MSAQDLTLYLQLILAALYLPMLFTLIQRHEEHEAATMFLSGFVLVAALLNVAEGLWRSGRLFLPSQQFVNDLQIYGALVLAFLFALTVVSFVRRDLRPWLGLGILWVLGFVSILFNTFRFGEVLWTNGVYSLTLERLAPTWAVLGWLVFMAGAVFTVRSAYSRSRQPLLRNRLNYWTPVFLLVALNDVLVLTVIPLPGKPIRLSA